jgi:hypothetical protein
MTTTQDLQLGDVVTLSGRPANVFFVFAGAERKANYVPMDWGFFLNEEYGSQFAPTDVAKLVARPNWTTGQQCVWNGLDATVSSVRDGTIYLEQEGSHIAVPVIVLTVTNVSLILKENENENEARRSGAPSAPCRFG